MRTLSRRTFLRGAGGVALALPFLDAMTGLRVARALPIDPANAPRRIIFVFSANGDSIANRFATRSETGFQLGPMLAPFEAYKNDMLFIEGLDLRMDHLPDGEHSDGHQQGGAALAPWTSGSGSFPIGGTNDFIGYVEGPSADIEMGNRLRAQHPDLRARSLVHRVVERSNNIWTVHAHAGPVGNQSPVLPEVNPYTAYAALFNNLGVEAVPPEVIRRIRNKRSALDLVLGEANALRTRLGASDARRVDQHLQSLREVERSLQDPETGFQASCNPQQLLPAAIDVYSDDEHARVGELFFKITALAFACDLTRVANFAWSGNTSNRTYRNLGHSQGHHSISHIEGLSESQAWTMLADIKRHLYRESTKLYDLLKATPDGNGTLWDHTLVVHWDELAEGPPHSQDNRLILFAGKAHDYFRTGRYIDVRNRPVNSFSDMLVNCFHYMGWEDMTRFGDARMGSGAPLASLR